MDSFSRASIVPFFSSAYFRACISILNCSKRVNKFDREIPSGIFLFASIKTAKQSREKKLENIADYLFFIALIGVLSIILIITFNFLM